jgi:hypothetical protein
MYVPGEESCYGVWVEMLNSWFEQKAAPSLLAQQVQQCIFSIKCRRSLLTKTELQRLLARKRRNSDVTHDCEQHPCVLLRLLLCIWYMFA